MRIARKTAIPEWRAKTQWWTGRFGIRVCRGSLAAKIASYHEHLVLCCPCLQERVPLVDLVLAERALNEEEKAPRESEFPRQVREAQIIGAYHGRAEGEAVEERQARAGAEMGSFASYGREMNLVVRSRAHALGVIGNRANEWTGWLLLVFRICR